MKSRVSVVGPTLQKITSMKCKTFTYVNVLIRLLRSRRITQLGMVKVTDVDPKTIKCNEFNFTSAPVSASNIS